MKMDFNSIRRKHRVSQPSNRRKTVSSSNLSCISYNSTSIGRKTVYVTLPKDFGCDVDLDGKILSIQQGGPAHSVGIIQIGDYVRIVDGQDSRSNSSSDLGMEKTSDIVKLQVTFGVLQTDMRPNCPLCIEIGNRSYTSLGIALTDSDDDKIQITSIQPGSLADRCGFLQPGDFLTSIYISADEIIPCSHFCNSYHVAQILRQLTAKNSSIKITILPSFTSLRQIPSPHFFPSSIEDIEIHSDSTLTLCESDSSTSNSNNYGNGTTFGNKTFRASHSQQHPHHETLVSKRQIEKVEELDEDNCCVLSFTLWKDPLYEDWGFSLVDNSDTDNLDNVDNAEGDTDSEIDNCAQVNASTQLLERRKKSECEGQYGAVVSNFRPGGPANLAGLKPGDKIIQINGRDVSKLESTMLVPILACLENALNLLVLRDPDLMFTDS